MPIFSTLLLTVLFLCSSNAFAQKTITFSAPNDTLTAEMVDSTLEFHGLTEDSAFHAVGDNTVKVLGDNAFSFTFHSKSIISADFPEVVTIGEDAFAGLSNWLGLRRVNFPKVVNIMDGAFNWCEYLTEVDFPNAIHIGSAFAFCESLASVNFPQAETIGKAAFLGCDSLVSVSFPRVKSIGENAFAGCQSLISASFPNAKTISNEAFGRNDDNGNEYCHNITALALGSDFATATEIKLDTIIWGNKVHIAFEFVTDSVNLTLGSNVLPVPDLANNTWAGYTDIDGVWHDHKWKSISYPTGIEEHIHKFYIYPNPTTDFLTVNMEFLRSGSVKIALIDIIGNEIMQLHNGFVETGNFNKTFSIANIPSGVYFMKVAIENSAFMKKIVKK